MSLYPIGLACHSATQEGIQGYPDVMSCQSSACEIKLGMVWISHGVLGVRESELGIALQLLLLEQGKAMWSGINTADLSESTAVGK